MEGLPVIVSYLFSESKSKYHEIGKRNNQLYDFLGTILELGYLCFDQITKNMEYLTQYLLYPHMWGGKREEEKVSMLPEDIVNFSP